MGLHGGQPALHGRVGQAPDARRRGVRVQRAVADAEAAPVRHAARPAALQGGHGIRGLPARRRAALIQGRERDARRRGRAPTLDQHQGREHGRVEQPAVAQIPDAVQAEAFLQRAAHGGAGLRGQEAVGDDEAGGAAAMQHAGQAQQEGVMQIDAAGQAEPGRPQMLGADVGGIGDDQIVGAVRGAGLQEIRRLQVQGQAGKAPGHALRRRRQGVPVRIVAADLQGAHPMGG